MKRLYLLVALAQIVVFQVLCKPIEDNSDVDWMNDERYLSYKWEDGKFSHGVPNGIQCPPLEISNSDNGRVICTTATNIDNTPSHIFCLPECIIGKTLSVVPQAFICRTNDPGHWKSPRNDTLPTSLSCD